MDIDSVQKLLESGAMIVGGASIISAFFPHSKADGALKVAKTIIDLMAFNFKNARNAEPK